MSKSGGQLASAQVTFQGWTSPKTSRNLESLHVLRKLIRVTQSFAFHIMSSHMHTCSFPHCLSSTTWAVQSIDAVAGYVGL